MGHFPQGRGDFIIFSFDRGPLVSQKIYSLIRKYFSQKVPKKFKNVF